MAEMLKPGAVQGDRASGDCGAEGRSRLPHIIITVAAKARGQFSAAVDGQVIVESSATPFIHACRHLLELGTPSDTVAIMRHLGSNVEALKSTVGGAAEVDVVDGRFTRHRPRGEGSETPQFGVAHASDDDPPRPTPPGPGGAP